MKACELLRLPDGRDLAFADLGAAAGDPILYMHGLPGSRVDLVALDRVLTALDIRVIAPDRPGIGRSTPQSGRTLLDLAGDVRCLARELGVERFGVLGLSGGAPYALACGYGLPDLVSRVAITGGVTPLNGRGARQGMKAYQRVGLVAVRRLPRTAVVAYGAVVPAFEAVELRRHPGFRATHEEAHRQGPAGVTADLQALARPWGFSPAEIACPVEFWHGDRDNVIPLALATGLAKQVGGELHICPGEGHHLLRRHLRAVLRAARPAPAA